MNELMKQFNRKKGEKKCCITNLNNLIIVICEVLLTLSSADTLACIPPVKIFMPFSNAKINVCII